MATCRLNMGQRPMSFAPFGFARRRDDGQDLGGPFLFIKIDNSSALLQGCQDFLDAGLSLAEVRAVTRDKFFNESTQSVRAELVVRDLHEPILQELVRMQSRGGLSAQSLRPN